MTMQEQEVQKKGTRSPSYPTIDLETAIARARELYNKENMNSAAANVILSHWGYSNKSGAGLVVLAALLKFGLLADEGAGDKRKGRLTDLARRIILDDRAVSPDRDALIREAALNPKIHKDLWEQYKGTLPSDENLRHELRLNKNFTDFGASELIKEFRNTIAFAKLAESGIISPDGKDKQPPDGGIQMPNMFAGPLDTPQVTNKASGASIQVSKPSQTPKQVPIPLTNASWGILQLPFPMTEDDWDEFVEFVSHMKGPFTGTRKQKPCEDQGKQG